MTFRAAAAVDRGVAGTALDGVAAGTASSLFPPLAGDYHILPILSIPDPSRFRFNGGGVVAAAAGRAAERGVVGTAAEPRL